MPDLSDLENQSISIFRKVHDKTERPRDVFAAPRKELS